MDTRPDGVFRFPVRFEQPKKEDDKTPESKSQPTATETLTMALPAKVTMLLSKKEVSKRLSIRNRQEMSVSEHLGKAGELFREVFRRIHITRHYDREKKENDV